MNIDILTLCVLVGSLFYVKKILDEINHIKGRLHVQSNNLQRLQSILEGRSGVYRKGDNPIVDGPGIDRMRYEKTL